jgi:protein-tyrosine phosphatase
MIDLHCHLFPGIDDGPATLAEALAMARLAVAEGITRSVVTPHLHLGRWDNDRARVEAAAAGFRAALAEAGIVLDIGFAAEVRAEYAILQLIEEDRVPFLGILAAQRVMLLEFPHGSVPVGSEKLVEWLVAHRVLPMIAHPERNKDIMRDPSRLGAFVDAGCLVQLTADALDGGFGERSRECAVEFLERGWASVLASDAHDCEARPPRISRGLAVARSVVGDAAAQELVQGLPSRIIGGA